MRLQLATKAEEEEVTVTDYRLGEATYKFSEVVLKPTILNSVIIVEKITTQKRTFF